MTMRSHLLILLLIGLCIGPVAADIPYGFEQIIGGTVTTFEGESPSGGFNASADENYAIHTAELYQPLGSIGTFSVMQYNRATYYGSWTRTQTGPWSSNLQITFNGETINADVGAFAGLLSGLQPQSGRMWIRTMKNSTTNETGLLLWVYGWASDGYVWIPMNLTQYPIASFSYMSNDATTYYRIQAMDLEYYMDGGASGGWFSVLDFFKIALDLIWTVLLIFGSLFYWFKFIFVDNFLLVIGLFEGFSLAVACNSKDIFTAAKKWWHMQESLVKFLIGTLQTAFSIAQSIRDTFLRLL